MHKSRLKYLSQPVVCLLFFSAVFTISCNQDKGFEKIDEAFYLNRENLTSKINPNREYAYWEYVYAMPGHMYKPIEVLFSHGDSTLKSNYKIKTPESGFFSECMPAYCYSYIIFISNNKLNYVVNESQLQAFINRVDNIEEALLLAKIKGLWFDPENKDAGSYKKTAEGFELKLGRFESCPVTSEAMKVKIDTLGNFKSESRGIYFSSSECILE